MQGNERTLIAIGVLLPFAGTTLGAAAVLFLKHEVCPFLHRVLLGFAAGVMVAASVWSLLLPALEMSAQWNRFSFVPAVVGFVIGIVLLLIIDRIVSRIEEKKDTDAKKDTSQSTLLLAIAVTLHNIPEGMAVGVVFAGVLANQPDITMAGAMAISIGIAIQNIPEGAVISMPLREKGKGKAFWIGTASGVVEPVAAGLTLLLTRWIQPILPYLLAFAAGAMMFVVTKELMPEASEEKSSYVGTIGFTVGFLIMMALDVALG